MRVPYAIAAVLLAAAPAWAVKDWSDYYQKGLQLERAGQYKEALKEFQKARAEKKESGVRERLYSLEFIDYFPYYHEGICHQALGAYDAALRSFNEEAENQRKIQENEPAFRDLKQRRVEVRNKLDAIDQERIRGLRASVDKGEARAKAAREAHRYEEALAAYVEAISTAALLDESKKRQLERDRDATIEEQKKAEEAADKRRRIEQLVAEAQRLLGEGKDTEAAARFENVIALDPQNAAALDGKKAANDSIQRRLNAEMRRQRLAEGVELANQGKYAEALLPLTDAASAGDAEARVELDRVNAVLERMRNLKARNERVEQLMAQGEKLFTEKKYNQALARFESALERDPGNVRAQDRRTVTERLLFQQTQDLWFPPQPPEMVFTEPSGPDVKVAGPFVTLDGFAWDDRQLERIEYHVGGRLVRHIEPRQKNQWLHERLELAHGANEILVRAVDSQGQPFETSFRVMRLRQLHEQPWFFPAAAGTSLALVGMGFAVQRARRRHAIRRRFNPYIAGAPILNDDMFYGRRKLLARIMNVLHHNSLMITGERRIGKTTLLYQLKKALEADDTTEYRFFPVFIDLQGVDENTFFQSVMADTIEAVRLSPEGAAGLRFRSEHTEYHGRDFSHDLQRIVEELKRRTPKKVKLALLIDEVDVLNSYSERINQRLRSIFMKTFSEHLVAIMSGVGVKRIWTSEGSPWYNFFDEIELTPFSREEAEALVRQPVDGYFRWDAEAVEAVLRWSGGKPYLVQKMCIHAVNHMLEEGRTTVTADDVDAAREMAQSFAEDEPPSAEKVLA